MITIIGNGGHAKVVNSVLSYFPDWISASSRHGNLYFVAIGDNKDRKKEAETCSGDFLILVHPSAVVEANVSIGNGTIIMANAVIQAGAKIGKHCIVNSGATVDHDCILEDYVHIAPGAHLCGNVHVGEGALVGVGACAVPGAKIAPWSLVKALTVAK